MNKLLNFLSKSLLLSTCSGISLSIFIVTYTISIDPVIFFKYWRWSYAPGIIVFFIIGFLFCLFFGSPFLFFIDKYFQRFTLRYVFGGIASALILWLGMAIGGTSSTPFFALAPGPLNWPLSILFMTVGASTGALYTLTLWGFEKFKNRRT